MILKEKNLLSFEDNDIYQVETYGDKIIVNEDYNGIRILDSSLNTLKIISITEGLIVHSIYKQANGNSIIIYDFDHKQLIFIDLEICNPLTINLEIFVDHYFWPYAYHWKKNILIFALQEKYGFYQLNFTSFSLEKISSKEVRIIAPSFFEFLRICKKYNIISIDSEKQNFIFKKNRKLIGFYNYNNKSIILTKHKLSFFEEEIHYYNGYFIFFYVWEKNIVFQKHKMFIRSEDPYYCLRINCLTNGIIIILETNKNDHKFCRLGAYVLQG